MRDVEDAHDAIDQRQPGRHQEQPGRIDDAVERNGQDVVHGSEAAAAAGGRRLRSYFFEAGLDPGFALDAVRRIHLVGRVARDVDDRELAARGLGGADRRIHHRLMALAERHLHGAARTLEGQVLERRDDLVLVGLVAAAALGLLVGGLHAEDRLRHLERRIVRRHLVAVLIGGLQPARELGVGRERPERSARAEDGAVGNARAEPVDRRLARRQDHLVLLEQAARRALQHEALEIAAPQARMDHLGAAAEQRGDLGAELAGEQPRHLRGLHLDAGLQRLHRALEVGPGVLAPGVVLVDAGERLHVREAARPDRARPTRYPSCRSARCGTRICSSRPRRCAACRSRTGP